MRMIPNNFFFLTLLVKDENDIWKILGDSEPQGYLRVEQKERCPLCVT